ncbi:unnamed protein product [Meganyctiphanes norvegica]|uniref:Uncharacterized protein n=1 Tax=Meganyctiphanes norvegica TaxID=48144 RepID=A0AAV2SDJ6_MEGNR
MIYYTCGDQNTVKMDIVCRLLSDRGWRVGELVATLLQYCDQRLEAWKTARKQGLTNVLHNSSEANRYNICSPLDSMSLFDELIEADRPYVHLETEL